MKILALETSAKSVSVAVTEEGRILGSAYQNVGLTHSRTLMPLLDAMLKNSGLTLVDMGLIAVAAGPGSFTGLRIGVSAAKGLAWAQDLPCCGVSTLEAMAQNFWRPKRKGGWPRPAFDLNAQAMLRTIAREFL